jgi:hypothetical protein
MTFRVKRPLHLWKGRGFHTHPIVGKREMKFEGAGKQARRNGICHLSMIGPTVSPLSRKIPNEETVGFALCDEVFASQRVRRSVK